MPVAATPGVGLGVSVASWGGSVALLAIRTKIVHGRLFELQRAAEVNGKLYPSMLAIYHETIGASSLTSSFSGERAPLYDLACISQSPVSVMSVTCW